MSAAKWPGRLLRWRRDPTRSVAPPSWLLSLILHLVLFVGLAWAFRIVPSQKAAGERTAEVGIVLRHQDQQQTYYVGEEDAGDESAPGPSANDVSNVGSNTLADVLGQATTIEPTGLPAPRKVAGFRGPDGGLVGNAGEAGKGGGHGRGKIGGKAVVNVFGAEGEGTRFVYVFDCSTSMQSTGIGRSPIDAAKQELLASLESLDDRHQFLIIFFNERPQIINPAGTPGRLAFATEQAKELARKRVRSVVARGRTNRLLALETAIAQGPDVIFFLTDVDDPMTRSQVERVLSRGAGIAINTIEFGYHGAQSVGDNFLVTLASKTRGQYVYVDITKPWSRQGN